jgi:hypothetical protein
MAAWLARVGHSTLSKGARLQYRNHTANLEPTTMTNLSHFTVTTGDLRMSPRSEVRERTLEMLKPVVRAGFSIVAA